MFELLKGIFKLFWYPAVFVFVLFLGVLLINAMWSFGVWEIEPLLRTFENLAWMRWAYIITFVFNLLRHWDEVIPY